MTTDASISFSALNHYLARLKDRSHTAGSVFLDGAGRAHGKFFNVTLTSAFQAIRDTGAARVVAFEGLARSHSRHDAGLSLWRLLDHAASDAESVALDRLCRMLHAINFYRQSAACEFDLYLSVHARLLAAVEDDHGAAFRRVLAALELPHEKIVLQLPVADARQDWLLNVVANNYRRNGFRLALDAGHAQQALDALDQVQAEVIKLDSRQLADEQQVLRLLRQAAQCGVRVVFKRVETAAVALLLRQLGERTGLPIYAQGYLWHRPAAALDTAGFADRDGASAVAGASGASAAA